mgnify:CR=1 FL=1
MTYERVYDINFQMDKKDIYEHLANIYLDASKKGKKRKKVSARLHNKPFTFGILAGIFCLFVAATVFIPRHKPFSQRNVALVITTDTIKINFNFDPAKKEVASIPLNNLNMATFRSIDFSAKRANYNDVVTLRVEFINSFNEKAEIYLRNIPHRWEGYRLNLADFKNIKDWSSMKELAFIVEEWNATEKNGIVFIDNVRFLR